MLKRVHHMSFTVSNLERSIEFYRDVLGLSLWFPMEYRGGTLAAITGMPDVHMKGAFMRLGDFRLELWQYLHPEGMKIAPRTCDVGSAHIAFLVDDIQEVYRNLLAKGVRFRSEPQLGTEPGPGKDTWSLYFEDPSGNTLELIELPPRLRKQVEIIP